MLKWNSARVPLIVLVRFDGLFLCCAALAIFLPTDWMASIHAALGLGAFPRTPVVEYLTRSIAALYAIHGALMVAISCEILRYLPLAQFAGLIHIVFGVVVGCIDLYARLPWYWTIFEATPVILVGSCVVWLSRALQKEVADESVPAPRRQA